MLCCPSAAALYTVIDLCAADSPPYVIYCCRHAIFLLMKPFM
ncbi:hypothetical protein A2U01_0112090, partial [Trifolium medium]|nr:hypothetical protein [Trifolium medium]